MALTKNWNLRGVLAVAALAAGILAVGGGCASRAEKLYDQASDLKDLGDETTDPALKQKNYQEAIKLLDETVELEPNNPRAHYRLGQCHRNLGDYDKATAAFLKVIELEPEKSKNYEKLLTVHMLAGRFDRAEKFYRSASELPLFKNYPEEKKGLDECYAEVLAARKAAAEKASKKESP